MAESQPVPFGKSTPERNHESPLTGDRDQAIDGDPEDLLNVLGDEYAQTILKTVASSDKPAREIATDAGISRPTAYRRLNTLEDLGMVESRIVVEDDGHHRKYFSLAVAEFSIGLSPQEFSITAA